MYERDYNLVNCLISRRLTDLQEQLTDLQQEFDVSKEECLGHQKVIQELKLNLEEVRLFSLLPWLIFIITIVHI